MMAPLHHVDVALPTPEPFDREDIYPEDAAFVRKLAVEELQTFYDCLQQIDQSITGIINLPRCESGHQSMLAWLDDLSERLSDIRSYAMEELERRPMSGDTFDDERSIAYIVEWRLKSCAGDPREMVETILRLKSRSDEAMRATAEDKSS